MNEDEDKIRTVPTLNPQRRLLTLLLCNQDLQSQTQFLYFTLLPRPPQFIYDRIVAHLTICLE